MHIGGFSAKGSYHDVNQDHFLTAKTENGRLIAVSDGVGSCVFSQEGSALACKSVKTVIDKYGGIPDDIDAFFAEIHSEWLAGISEFHEDPNDFCATLLFCYCTENRVFAARLGDGFIGIRTDGGDFVLFDNKDEHLINETDSLSAEHDPSAWDVLDLECDRICAVFITTDGLSVFPCEEEEYLSLLNDLAEEYAGRTTEYVEEDIERWIPLWESCDDKTIAFMIGG